jgi:hypothetical protein
MSMVGKWGNRECIYDYDSSGMDSRMVLLSWIILVMLNVGDSQFEY